MTDREITAGCEQGTHLFDEFFLISKMRESIEDDDAVKETSEIGL